MVSGFFDSDFENACGISAKVSGSQKQFEVKEAYVRFLGGICLFAAAYVLRMFLDIRKFFVENLSCGPDRSLPSLVNLSNLTKGMGILIM